MTRHKGIMKRPQNRDRARVRLLQRDGRHCHWCGQRMTLHWFDPLGALPSDAMTFDHVVPKALGGTNRTDNLVLACRACNHSHGERLSYYLQHTNRTTRCNESL